MESNVNTLKALKDKLIEERAVAQNDAKNTQAAIEKFKTGIDALTPEQFKSLEDIGIDTSLLKNIDYEGLAKNQTYVDSVVEQFDGICQKTCNYLSEALGI